MALSLDDVDAELLETEEAIQRLEDGLQHPTPIRALPTLVMSGAVARASGTAACGARDCRRDIVGEALFVFFEGLYDYLMWENPLVQ